MTRPHFIYLFCLLSILVSCNDGSIDLKEIPYDPKIVVEGSIESDGYPQVILSLSASIGGELDTLSLLNHVIKYAKVTVSDGDNKEILRLVTNDKKIPPYEYRGYSLKGVSGKTYSLLVEMDGKQITAETYIPKAVELDSIWVKKALETDTIAHLFVQFKNISEDYYQISTQVLGEENIYIPCLYGNIDKASYQFGQTVQMQVNKGPVIFPKANYKTYYKSPSEVSLKFSTQSKATFEFWTSFQNEILNSQNPIFPAHTNLKSNINGGVGVWGGYGVCLYQIDI